MLSVYSYKIKSPAIIDHELRTLSFVDETKIKIVVDADAFLQMIIDDPNIYNVIKVGEISEKEIVTDAIKYSILSIFKNRHKK